MSFLNNIFVFRSHCRPGYDIIIECAVGYYDQTTDTHFNRILNDQLTEYTHCFVARICFISILYSISVILLHVTKSVQYKKYINNTI